ncbi:MAG: AAA family ATPase [archaeon]
MVNAKAPVDITPERLKTYQQEVESRLQSFTLGQLKLDLTDLMNQLDEDEPCIMNPLETEAYITIRQGLQVFKAIADDIGKKVELGDKLVNSTGTDPVLVHTKDFVYNYATFVASSFVQRKLEDLLNGHIDLSAIKDKPDFKGFAIDTTKPELTVRNQLVAPLFAILNKHVSGGKQVFKTQYDFPLYALELFEHWANQTRDRKDTFTDMNEHLEGHRFRVLSGKGKEEKEVIALEGYENKSMPIVKTSASQLTFVPITENEIVGNQSAKRVIKRNVQRLFLYDFNEKKNPVMDIGGLYWSVLFDGPPGTGKTSMFRMAMTLLREYATALDVPYQIFTVDQSIKDEYYGKSGKILLERLNVAKDPTALVIGILDDIDLLTSTRKEAQGADNDINNILMQYLDGAFTMRLGNVINFAASNKPTGLDEAMRNRFQYRALIDGPKTAEDFADMIHLTMGRLMNRGLLKMENGAVPFATQDVQDESGHWSQKNVQDYMADEFRKYGKSSILDFGKFMADLKAKNPSITGRSMKAITEAIKERAADFDVPEEWLKDRKAYFDKPYAEKLAMVGKLYVPITPDMLWQEAQRYADSEERYTANDKAEAVEAEEKALAHQVEGRLRYFEGQVEKGADSEYLKLQSLQGGMQLVLDGIMKSGKDAKGDDKQ